MSDKKNKLQQKIIIGITGGIASGKSVIRTILEQLGCVGIDADKVGHEIIQPGMPAYQAILRYFGTPILDIDSKQINRKNLGAIVFQNPKALKELENITHPIILDTIQHEIEESNSSIAIEAIKLMQTSLKTICDQKWLVLTSPEIQINRLIEKRGISYNEAYQRVYAQRSINYHLSEIDFILNGDDSIERIHSIVANQWSALQTK